jgi:hypothetical protein
MGCRGAALAETAVSVGVALTLLFGAIEFTVLGFSQINADGAAYLAAHEAGLGLADAAVPKVVATPFGAAAANGVALTALPPDDTSVPVDYQYNLSGKRHGGASLVREAHEAATVTLPAAPALSFLGKGHAAVKIASTFIEPSVVFTNFGYNVQGVGFNTNAGVFNNHNAYFSTDANVPPYYVGFAYTQYCPGPTTFVASCQSGLRSIDLGLAEYLSDDNYGAALTGVQTGGTYELMACHQRAYVALLANAFPSATLATNSVTDAKYDETRQADLVKIYHWDSTYDGALHPGRGC